MSKWERLKGLGWPTITRDTVLVVGGILGFVNEAVFRDEPRVELLPFYAAAIAGAWTLHRDRRDDPSQRP